MIPYQRETDRNLKDFLKPLFVAMILFYFGYHALNGDRGLFALVSLSKELETTRAELEGVNQEKAAMEHRVALLRSESLDLDLVDEQARRMLGYAKPDEMIIYSH